MQHSLHTRYEYIYILLLLRYYCFLSKSMGFLYQLQASYTQLRVYNIFVWVQNTLLRGARIGRK